MENLPTLTTEETQRLRSDYPCIEHLEAGNVASWLMERQEQLLVRAKDERTGMNIAKLITLTGGVVGAVCYATSSDWWHTRRSGVYLGSSARFE